MRRIGLFFMGWAGAVCAMGGPAWQQGPLMASTIGAYTITGSNSRTSNGTEYLFFNNAECSAQQGGQLGQSTEVGSMTMNPGSTVLAQGSAAYAVGNIVGVTMSNVLGIQMIPVVNNNIPVIVSVGCFAVNCASDPCTPTAANTFSTDLVSA